MELAPATLLSHAAVLRTDPPKALAGRWPTSVAVLLRQALERSLVQLWRAKAPSLEQADYRAQFLLLPRYIDRVIAATASHTWSELSAACHQRAYDLPPTAGELARWFNATEALVREVARITAPRSAKTDG
jgi:hypothetical protein